jgi:hypothetical protein
MTEEIRDFLSIDPYKMDLKPEEKDKASNVWVMATMTKVNISGRAEVLMRDKMLNNIIFEHPVALIYHSLIHLRL